ncbi:MAG: hypothetical protein VR72_00635 [Clostridiaceae bacterium BRH_c20a]|nr:MAG: hypothetical protein VR72_00635 [Clostridiaceae bacterium BRH_c20a]
MVNKKTICFIATNYFSCEQVEQQLRLYLSKYIEVKTWCLDDMNILATANAPVSDLYIISSRSVYNFISEKIIKKLPDHKKVLIANRTLKVNNLEEILSLPPDTEALVVSTWKETAYEKVKLLHSYGIDKIKFYPYWRGLESYPKHVKLAITTGGHYVPPQITRKIDLGVRTLDLSTFMELITELDLPRETINEISNHYISTIINLGIRRIKAAEQSEDFKRKLQVILDTVDQAIIGIDQLNKIVVFNPAAESMLGINSTMAVGNNAEDILPELNFKPVINNGHNIKSSIQIIKNNYYIVNISPILDNGFRVLGAAATLHPTHEVRELDVKVRRELKNKGHVAKHTFVDLIGNSILLNNVINLAQKFATADLAILIEGESGTGKELFAQSIHNASLRKKSPFVAINFAALPENLAESELFGYEEGAFTGAKKGGKTGLFEEAHTGTIFLDEIGDAPLDLQKKLLRVLEEKEVRRVGGSVVTPIDVRIIAATNQNIRQLIKEGKFRQDLYYRLCAINLLVPPLRERREDIPYLIKYLARKVSHRDLLLEKTIEDFLISCEWPGNIRELHNVVQFMCGVVEPEEWATIKHLPNYILRNSNIPVDIMVAHNTIKLSEQLELVVIEFKRLGAIRELYYILDEIKKAAVFGKGIGRQALVKALKERALSCPEHKVRLWLKKLEQTGCISTGTTKQGSRLTALGEELFSYLREEKVYLRNGVELHG